MPNAEEKILQERISELAFTSDFKSVADKLGFETISDISEHHVSTLIEFDGFTYHMLQEYTQFMQKNNLSHLIKQH